MSLEAGSRLGPYKILSTLGAGGMGEVYRARDTKLGRDVAIKVLPSSFAADPDRLARFEREAQLLASLNHPHIAQIYGLEGQDGTPFIVMELVDGETIDARLKGSRSIPVPDTLRIARQIAEALDAAHERGIVHRDLKPANIVITPEGAVKVLDFGLAKLDQRSASLSGERELTHSPTLLAPTMDGVLLGTAPYMSPEQARGKSVDKRTDIWSFGCVLYEMLTGRRAFPGETTSDTIAAILEREPDWSALPGSTPPPIRGLLQRCLDKDPKRRLRDIGDAHAGLDDAARPPIGAASAQNRLGRTLLAFVVAAAGVVVAVLIALVVRGRDVDQRGDVPDFSRVVALTSGPDREFAPAISPDGKWVAYLSDAGGQIDVWVKFVAGGEAANLTRNAGLEMTASTNISGLEISPDGTRIALSARPRGTSESLSVWEIPAPLPGPVRKLLNNRQALRWSPDGRQVAFILAGGTAGDQLFVADADGANQKEIVPLHDGMHLHWLSWSRDRYIYFIYGLSPFNMEPSEIYRVKATGGPIQPVVKTARRAVAAAPMPDGTGLIYAANPESTDTGLWWRSNQSDVPRRLTVGVGEYAEPRVSADGRTLVCTLYNMRESLVRLPVTLEKPATTAITNGYTGDLDPQVAPSNDRLVFSSSRSGTRLLWTAMLDGSDARPLTIGASLDERPAFSPDSQQIAFISDRKGARAIWTIGREGGAARKIVDAVVISSPSWSPDGRQLVYAAPAGASPGLWTVAVADGQVKRLPTPGAANEPAWNPARDVIAYVTAAQAVAFVDSAGREVFTPMTPRGIGFANGMVAWSPDGKRLAAISQPTFAPASVWLIEPQAANPLTKVTEFSAGPRLRGISWTRDGTAVIVGKRDWTSDIVLLHQK